MRPSQCRYMTSHEWARLDGGLVTVGITDYAVHELSDLVFVDLPAKGTKVKRGQRFGEIESVKAVSDLYSPVDGEIVEINESIADSIDPIHSDPFGQGWMIKIKPSSSDPLAGLLSAEDYEKKLSSH